MSSPIQPKDLSPEFDKSDTLGHGGSLSDSESSLKSRLSEIGRELSQGTSQQVFREDPDMFMAQKESLAFAVAQGIDVDRVPDFDPFARSSTDYQEDRCGKLDCWGPGDMIVWLHTLAFERAWTRPNQVGRQETCTGIV